MDADNRSQFQSLAAVAFWLFVIAGAAGGIAWLLHSPKPTPDQLFGCKLSETTPSGECP